MKSFASSTELRARLFLAEGVVPAANALVVMPLQRLSRRFVESDLVRAVTGSEPLSPLKLSRYVGQIHPSATRLRVQLDM